tara:strand:+ start:628 stop:957 length:330 start_codon:yes stop_codon:yes gene_type:complete
MARNTGIVDWFNVRKGYGFIKVISDDDMNDTSVFCHQSNISPKRAATFRKLFPGEYVSFEIKKTDDKTEAVSIQGIGGGPLLIDNESYNYKFFPKTRTGQSESQEAGSD